MFVPKHSKSNRAITTPWFFNLLYLSGTWPLDIQASHLFKFVYNLWTTFVIGLCIFIFGSEFSYTAAHTEAEVYIIADNIGTAVLCINGLVRCIHLKWHQHRFRQMLAQFYDSIHFENDPYHLPVISRMKAGTTYLIISYGVTVLLFSFGPYMMQQPEQYPMPYKTIFFYRLDNSLVYWATYVGSCFAGFATSSVLFVEMNMISMLLSHLTGRYLELKQHIEVVFEESHRWQDIVYFRKRMARLFAWNIALNRFAELLNEVYSFRFFFGLMTGTLQVCLIVFHMAAMDVSTDFIKHFFWCIAAIGEQILIGYFGSELIAVSGSMYTQYYSCNWEQILLNSNVSQRDRSKVMQDILFLVTLFQKPAKITGMNFFDLSVVSAMNAIQKAFSYFMFLRTMNQVK